MIIIVNQGMGGKVLEFVMEQGIHGATAFHAWGALPNQLLKLLELEDIRKEAIMVAVPACHEKELFEKLTARFHFDHPGKGMIITFDLAGVYGSHLYQEYSPSADPGKMSALQGVMTIVDKSQAEEALDHIEGHGFMRGIVIDAHSSADKSDKFCDLMLEAEKEIIFIFTTRDKTPRLARLLTEYFDHKISNGGILAIFNLQRTVGITLTLKTSREESDPDMMERKAAYSVIFAIVKNHMDEAVIRSAERAGSTGGTIIHARGSCCQPMKNFFFRGVEPEREIVMIIAKDEHTKGICDSINTDLKLDQPGNGLLLVVPLYTAQLGSMKG